MMKTIDVKWFSNTTGCIGIILAEDEHKQVAYIGSVEGHNEEFDIGHIKEWGSKLSLEQAIGFFGSFIKKERYKR